MISLDKARVGALWRLKGRLMLRAYSREKGRLVGAVILLLVLVPFVLFLAVGSVIGYWQLPEPWPAQLLGVVLVGLWLAWLFFPIFFSSLNEATDMTRLLVFPLRQRDLIAGVLLGTLFDYPTYLVLPLLIAVLIGWGASVALPVVLLAVLLSFAHMVFIGLLIGTVLGGVLQSRRFRDVAIVFTALIGSSCYFLQVGVSRLLENLARTMGQEQLLALRPLLILKWFPTGAAAQAIALTTDGIWLAGLGWLLYSAAWLGVVVWAWWRLVLRLTTGDGFLVSLAPREKAVTVQGNGRSRSLPGLLNWLPADIAQLTSKELRSVWRVPQRRVSLVQGVLAPFFIAAIFFFRRDGEFLQAENFDFGLIIPLYALFLFWSTSFNMLGWDGKGLPTLFLTPLPRQRIFLGKGAALYGVAALTTSLIGVVMLVMRPDWVTAAGVLTGLMMGLPAIAVTAVFGVLFPSPIDQNRRRRRSAFSTRGGCLTGLANFFLLLPLIILVNLPVAIPLVVAYFFDQPWIAFVAIPLVLLYALVAFWLGCRTAGNLLTTREPEVLQATRVEL